MNTDENISAYHDNGPPNYWLVAEYLQLPRPRELASLAASLANKNSDFDPASLVKMAEDLRLQAKQAFVSRQTELLNQMNFNTLIALHFSIHGDKDRNFMVRGYKDRLYHPIAGPLALQFQIAINNRPRHLLRLDHLKADSVLRQVEERTQMDRPKLPCSREAAIRWVTGAPSASLDALTHAHRDFLASQYAQPVADHLWKNIEVLKERLAGHEAELAELSFHDSTDEETNDRIRHIKALINESQGVLEDRLNEANAVASYIIKSGISNNIPDVILKYAKEWCDVLNKSQIKNVNDLATLARGFHEFWNEHGKYYEKVEHNKKDQAKASARRKKEAGGKGNRSREQNKLRALTQAFCKYLSECPKPLTNSMDPDGAIDGFMNGTTMTEGVTPKRALEFLRTLGNAAMTPALATVNIEVLSKRPGFKAVGKEFLHEMMALMSEVLQQPKTPAGQKQKPKASKLDLMAAPGASQTSSGRF